jgi:hypothetical protein
LKRYKTSSSQKTHFKKKICFQQLFIERFIELQELVDQFPLNEKFQEFHFILEVFFWLDDESKLISQEF